MKFDPDTLKKAREWFAKRAALLGIGALGLLGLLVLAANIHAGIGHKAAAAAPAVAAARAPATRVVTPKPAQAPPSAIPHIAQQPGGAPAATAALATAPAAPVPVAAPIQPPAGIQHGFILQKNYQPDQFGTPVLVSTKAVGVQTVSVQAAATDGDGGRETEWSAWINLQQPTTLAWVRLAGGEGTVAVKIDGNSLGQPVDHWASQGPVANFASIPLGAGWHQVTIHDTRRGWVRGDGVAVQITLGTAATTAVSPQPWAVPPDAAAPAPTSSAIPQITQHQPAAASIADPPKPASTTTTGGAP